MVLEIQQEKRKKNVKSSNKSLKNKENQKLLEVQEKHFVSILTQITNSPGNDAKNLLGLNLCGDNAMQFYLPMYGSMSGRFFFIIAKLNC